MRDRTAALLLGITSVALRLGDHPQAADALGLGYLFVVTVGIGQLPGLLEQARTRTHPAYVSEP